jgi:alkylation response protein AidB-like acyl-CoA dehydrogenase
MQGWDRPDFAVRIRGVEKEVPARRRAGASIAAFAISEDRRRIGSLRDADDGAIDGAHIVINGEKTWISNAGIAGTTSCSAAGPRAATEFHRAGRGCGHAGLE